MATRNATTALALPAARTIIARDNLLERPAPATVPAATASPAAAPVDANSPIYSANMFNINNPAAARLPMLAAHIMAAMAAGKASTCAIYNYLRDTMHWTHLPGSVAFRAATQAAGLLDYTGRNGRPLQQGHRTSAAAGPALASIARCYNAPATGTEGNA